jgi:hypothetical protein
VPPDKKKSKQKSQNDNACLKAILSHVICVYFMYVLSMCVGDILGLLYVNPYFRLFIVYSFFFVIGLRLRFYRPNQ